MSDNVEWVLVKQLGSGGYGIIELWKNKQNNNELAIKRCTNEGNLMTKVQKERWIREVEILQKLKHDNIISTLPLPLEIRIRSSSDLPLLCMEFCSLGDVRRVLNETENLCGINEKEAFNILSDVLSAVKYLHENKITHRDLKPENVVVQLVDSKIKYKLIDLGYAKELDESSQCASLIGTLNYVAPELFWRKKYSCSVDYWSLGIFFYEILTNRRPFLPDEKNTMTWIKQLMNKKFDVIGADNIDDRIIYLDRIREPAQISECLKTQMQDWFKVALQWDPHLRGRHPDNPNNLIIFSLLEEIINTKVAHVFLSSYKKVSYITKSDTTIGELKQKIAIQNNLELNSLVLISSENLQNVDDPTTLIYSLSNEKRINFLAFESKCSDLKIEKLSKSTSAAIKFVLYNEKSVTNDYTFTVQCYRDTIFLIQNELELYSNFIRTLIYRIDSMLNSIELLKKEIQNCNKDDLFGEAKKIMQSDDPEEIKNKFQERADDLLRKIHTKLPAIQDISTKLQQNASDCLQHKKQIDTFNSNSSYEKVIQKLLEHCDVSYGIYKKSKESEMQNKELKKLISLLKTYFTNKSKFIDYCCNDFVKKIVENESKLYKISCYLKSYNSVQKIYEEELHLLKEEKSKESSLLQRGSDMLIYNNFVLQKKLDNLIHKMNKSINKSSMNL